MNFIRSPKNSIVNSPDIGQSDIFNIGSNLELPSFLNFL